MLLNKYLCYIRFSQGSGIMAEELSEYCCGWQRNSVFQKEQGSCIYEFTVVETHAQHLRKLKKNFSMYGENGHCNLLLP